MLVLLLFAFSSSSMSVSASGMGQEAADVAFGMLLILVLTLVHVVFILVVLIKKGYKNKKHIRTSMVFSILTILSAMGLGWPNEGDLGGLAFKLGSYIIPVSLSVFLYGQYKRANA